MTKMAANGIRQMELGKWTDLWFMIFFKTIGPKGLVCTIQGQNTCILPYYSKIFLSEITWQIKAKFDMKHL